MNLPSTVKFVTEFDYARGIVPGESLIFESFEPNYGSPLDYDTLDIVYVTDGTYTISGFVVSKNFPGDGNCYIVIKPLFNGVLLDMNLLSNYFQGLEVLCAQGNVLP